MDNLENSHEIKLQSEAIILRPYRLEDAEAHLAGEDEQQIKWLSGGKGTLEGVRNWIEKNQAYWRNDGPRFNFAIEDISTHNLIGMVEANKDWQSWGGYQEGDVNISYVLYPSARGKGYATKAVELISEFLKTKGAKRTFIRVSPENISSVKIAKRLGYQKVGTSNAEHGSLDIYLKNL